jgi:hypothetical protein
MSISARYAVVEVDRRVMSALWVLAVLLLPLLPGIQGISSSSTSSISNFDPQLPFGDINVVVLTDVHSWLASHKRQEPYMDVDLGNVLSFWERLKEFCDLNDMDLFFGTTRFDAVQFKAMGTAVNLCKNSPLRCHTLLLTFITYS